MLVGCQCVLTAPKLNSLDHAGVDSSTVYSVGCSGVRVAGGEARSLTAGNSYATNNNISTVALVKRTYNPGMPTFLLLYPSILPYSPLPTHEPSEGLAA